MYMYKMTSLAINFNIFKFWNNSEIIENELL